MSNLFKGDFRKIDDNTFFLNYTQDYGLDELLSKGASNIVDLINFVQKRFDAKKGDIKLKTGGAACTTFNTFTKDDQHLLARNFDYKDAPAIVVWTSPENGYKSIGITDPNVMLCGRKVDETEYKNRLLAAPYVCMDGINEKGLAIAVLELKTSATKQNTGKTPITTTAMIRAVLDKCATIEEAVQLFASYDMHDSLFCCYHYQISDANGRSAIIEYIDNKMTVVYPKDKTQYALNFYASPDVKIKKAFGFTREKWLHEEFKATGNIMDEERAMKVLQKCKLYYRHKRGYMITSLWSAVYNNNEKTMLFCANMEYDKQYKFSVDYDKAESFANK